jgi:MFS family permease
VPTDYLVYMPTDYLVRRWTSLAASVLLASICGVGYLFALYSPALREHFHLTQSRTDLVASAADMVGLLGIFGGLLYYKCGSPATALLAGAAGSVGWLLLWGAFVCGCPAPYAALLAASCLQSVGGGLFDMIAVVSAAENFPERRGQALGVTKSLVGLSAALFSIGYEGFLAPDVVSLLCVIGVLYAAATLVGATCLSRPPAGALDAELALTDAASRAASEQLADDRLSFGLSWVIGLIVLSMCSSLLSGELLAWSPAASARAHALLAVLTYVAFLGGLLWLGRPPPTALHASAPPDRLAQQRASAAPPTHGHGGDSPAASPPQQPSASWLVRLWRRGTATLSPHRQPPAQPPAHAADRLPPNAASHGAVNGTDAPNDKSRPPPARPLRTAALLGLFLLASTPTLGSGLMLINNLDSLLAGRTPSAAAPSGGEAAPTPDASAFVSLVSSGSAAGRLLAGYSSDAALHQLGMPRPLALGLANALLGTAILTLSLGGLPPLYLASGLGGVAYGAINCLIPAVRARLWSSLFDRRSLTSSYRTVTLSRHPNRYTCSLCSVLSHCDARTLPLLLTRTATLTLHPVRHLPPRQVLSELFGLSMLPVLYPLVSGFALALGSLAFNTLLYGGTLDAALERHHLTPTQPCRFPDCYLPAVRTAALGCALGAAACVAMAFLTAREEYAQYTKRQQRVADQLI